MKRVFVVAMIDEDVDEESRREGEAQSGRDGREARPKRTN